MGFFVPLPFFHAKKNGPQTKEMEKEEKEEERSKKLDRIYSKFGAVGRQIISLGRLA